MVIRLAGQAPYRIVVAFTVGVLLGVTSILITPMWVLAGLVFGGLVFITLKRPEVGLLGILVATSSIIFEDKLPLIPIGIGSLHLADLILLSLLGLIVLRLLVEPEFKIVRTPLDWPLLIFFGVTLLSTSIAILQESVEVEAARRALRVMSYYLTFFIVTNLVRERRQLNFLLNSVFLLANFVAVAMVAQFLLGESLYLLPGRVESLRTQGVSFGDITRILPPGLSIVLIAFVAIFCILVLEKFRPQGFLKLLQWGLIGMALIFTFLRSYWAVLIVVLLLLAYILRGHDRQRLIGWGLVVVFSTATFLLIVFSDPGTRAARLVDAFIDRLSTLGSSETLKESSLQWRYMENRYALQQIALHPLLGLGLGAKYRPWDLLDQPLGTDEDFDPRGHIHNGHLWILLNTGLLGYLAFIWLSLSFLIRGFRYWRCISDPKMRGIVLGFTLAYLGVVIAAVVNSTFVQWRWTPVIGIIMGINEVILRKVEQEG